MTPDDTGSETIVTRRPRVGGAAIATHSHNRGKARRLLTDRVLLPLCGVMLLLVAWEATVIAYRLPIVVLPSPWSVAATLLDMLTQATFWRYVGVSLYEFGAGYAIGVILGIVVGALMAESRVVRASATPVIESLRFIVPFAWIPLTVLWFGTNVIGKIVLVAYAVFFVIAVSTTRSILHIEPTLSRIGTMLGMNRWELALQVHLRAAAPSIASAARAAAAIGWIAVVAAEYIGASAGLGFMITNAATSLATGVVIAGMIVIGLVGASVSVFIGWLSKTLFEYR